MQYIKKERESLFKKYLDKKFLKQVANNWQLYILLLLPLAFIITFAYIPMYGVQIAFKEFMIRDGIQGSPWVGFKYFKMFFDSPMLVRIVTNTLKINLYMLIVGFPAPIIFALALNEITHVRFKKTVQMVTYAPHFISTVVMVSIIMQVLNPKFGLINNITQAFGIEQASNWLSNPSYFSSIYVWTDIWQHMGWDSVIYIAALSGIDTQLYDAAKVDGANRFQKMMNIDLPGIAPTIIILLILRAGEIMGVGFEKVFLMQNDLNLRASEVISTYVYKVGLVNANYSYSTAIGLFNTVINFILLLSVNKIASKVGETSLW